MKKGPYKKRPVMERLMPKIEKSTDAARCWRWLASVDKHGYGQFYYQRLRRAHAVVYELLVGQIPTGMELDHLCRNTRCVNPTHLELVTHKENIHRGTSVMAANAAKTHCHLGHEFSQENTGYNTWGNVTAKFVHASDSGNGRTQIASITDDAKGQDISCSERGTNFVKTKTKRLQYRHGDVGLIASEIPTRAKKVAVRPLAYGEVTGHSHSIAEADLDGAEIYEFGDRSFLRVTKEEGIALLHQEHAEIKVAPGDYEIRIAREYDEEQDFRPVLD